MSDEPLLPRPHERFNRAALISAAKKQFPISSVQLTECVTFRQADANALRFLVDIGFNDTGVQALQPGQFIARSLHTAGETRDQVFSPKKG